MFEEEFSEFDWFCTDVFEMVGTQTNFKAYEAMSEESRTKWREKLVVMICKAHSPRKKFDMSKDEVRAMVSDAIAFWSEPVDESAQD